MPPEIFSSLHTQVNTQSQQLFPGISPQENTGTIPGMFDALIAEYTITGNTADIQPETAAQNHPLIPVQGTLTHAPAEGEFLPAHDDNANFRTQTEGESLQTYSGGVHAEKSPQPVRFGNNYVFMPADIASGENALPEMKQSVPENVPSWQNIFACSKRSPSVPVKAHENFSSQNDFDDGIIIADAETENTSGTDKPAEISAPADFMTDKHSHAEQPADIREVSAEKLQVIPASHELASENTEPEISDQVLPEIDRPNHDNAAISDELRGKSEPEISDQALPEIDRPNHDNAAISDELRGESEPEISKPASPEIDRPNHDNAAISETSGTESDVKAENHRADMLPNNEIKPSQASDLLRMARNETPPETLRMPEIPSANTETQPDLPAENITPKITSDDAPREISAHEQRKAKQDFDVPAEYEGSVTQTTMQPEKLESQKETELHEPQEAYPVRSSHELHETIGEHEIPAVRSEPETQEAKEAHEAQETQETHERHNAHDESEIPEMKPDIVNANVIMSGLQAVPPAALQPEISPEMNITENSDLPGTADSTEFLHPRNNSPRRSQTSPREAQDRITAADSDMPAEDSRVISQDSQRMTQNQYSHEESSQQEIRQPSLSGRETPSDDTDISSGTIQPRPARASRTAQRSDSGRESRTDTRRTETLNDFQSFFDRVDTVRRSPARASTQPLSLRTGTYEADGIQSQSHTLRNGIVNTVRFIRADGVRKANIIVDPPALGRISVELTSSSSGVEASVKVANEQIRQIVQDQFTQLRDNLLQQGVQVSELTVDVQQDSSRQGQDSGGQGRRDYYSYTPSENDDDAEIFRADLEEGLLYWIA